MKYLGKYFENNFTKTVNGKTIGDGIKFEGFIKEILNCEYKGCINWRKYEIGKIINRKDFKLGRKHFRVTNPSFKLTDIWLNTMTTHDGGKDFVLVSKNFTLWAECKNYTKRLSLADIANTLIFAHINDIKEVLIFSCSKLNKNAQQTISQYFKFDNKVVRIIDDEILENLIILHYDKLKLSFPDLPELDLNQIKIANIYNTHIYELQLYRDNVSQQVDFIPKRISQVSKSSIIGIDVLIKNNSFKKENFVVKINFGVDDYNFINIFDNTRAIVDSYEVFLNAYEQKIFSSYYRILSSEKEIKLPTIKIEIPNSQNEPYEISSGKLSLLESERINLVGQEHFNLKYKVESKFSKGLKGILIYGRSGTGKSRMQEEILPYFAINKVRIIHLNIKEWDLENTNETIVFKKLLFKLFNIPYNTNSLLLKHFCKKFGQKSKVIAEILDNPYMLNDSKKFECFFKQLNNNAAHTKICLAIDNVQFLNTKIVQFLYKLAERNTHRDGKLKFVWTINVDYLIEGGSENEHALMQLFQMNKKYLLEELHNFNDDDLALFIREVLKCNLIDDIKDIKNVLGSYSNNPYILKALIEWLCSNNMIDYQNNKYEISPSFSKEYLIADDLSTDKTESSDLTSPLKKIWEFYVAVHPDKKENLILIIAAVHFLGKLLKRHFSLFKLSLNDAEDLCSLHFLKREIYDNNEAYVFDHDIVELCFTSSIAKHGSLTELFLKHISADRVNFEAYSLFCNRYYLIYSILNDIEPSSLTEANLRNLIELTDLNDLPCNIEKEYLALYSRFLLNQLDKEDKIKILAIFRSIAGTIRERMGSKFLIEVYDKVYEVCKKNYNSLVVSDTFGWFIIEYCNLLSDYGRMSEAELIMERILSDTFYSDVNGHFLLLKAYFLNRYGGYLMKQRTYDTDNEKITAIFNDSILLSDTLKEINTAWAAEIKFLNYFDLGYLHYYDKCHQNFALNMFERANIIFEESNLYFKTMNYYHNSLIISIIKKNLDAAIELAQEAISYCYIGKFHYYDGFFMEHYLILQSIAYLMRNEANDITLCENNLKKVRKFDNLISINFMSLVYQIEGVCAHYRDKNEVAMDKFLNAYALLIEDTTKSMLNERIEQLKFNILKLNEIVYGRRLEKIIFKRKSQGIFDNLINELNNSATRMAQGKSIGNPRGIFTDKNNNFNLPFI